MAETVLAPLLLTGANLKHYSFGLRINHLEPEIMGGRVSVVTNAPSLLFVLGPQCVGAHACVSGPFTELPTSLGSRQQSPAIEPLSDPEVDGPIFRRE